MILKYNFGIAVFKSFYIFYRHCTQKTSKKNIFDNKKVEKHLSNTKTN